MKFLPASAAGITGNTRAIKYCALSRQRATEETDLKALVLGAGVIGVSTAYYLAEAGHDVIVLDRQTGPALETSFANAGEISPGYSSPWATPGLPLKALKWMFMRRRPLFIRPHLDPQMVRWVLMLLRNCTSAAYERNKGRMVPVAEYSRDLLRELRAKTAIRYDERSQGTSSCSARASPHCPYRSNLPSS